MEYLKEADLSFLKVGNKYTKISVSDMAWTVRTEFTFVGIETTDYAQYNQIAQIKCQIKGKRKLYTMFVKQNSLILDGWNLDLKIDTDGSSFCGNALINLVGTTEHITEMVKKNMNPKMESGIITIADESTPTTKKLLFPKQAEEIQYAHAVVQRMLGEQEGLT